MQFAGSKVGRTGAKTTGNGFKFLWKGDCKAENVVDVIAADWLIGKAVKVESLMTE